MKGRAVPALSGRNLSKVNRRRAFYNRGTGRISPLAPLQPEQCEIDPSRDQTAQERCRGDEVSFQPISFAWKPSNPRSTIRDCTAGSANARTVATLSLPMISRSEKPIPTRIGDRRQPHLGHSRDVARQRRARLACDRIGFLASGAQLRQNGSAGTFYCIAPKASPQRKIQRNTHSKSSHAWFISIF
jgi:hypothetical protein